MRLRSIRKYDFNDGNLSARIKNVADTLTEIIPLSKKIGVTRISDITYMDKLYIPNYSAFLPGTEDSFWVYSGKGPTKTQAQAGALMESIERYSSLHSNYREGFIRGTHAQLSKIYKKVLHPDEVVEPVLHSYKNDTILDFMVGFDLLSNEEVLVPAQLALYKYLPTQPANYAFPYSHTNGLASGNILEEAICHALCEVIERDAISIADLCASSIPYSILTKIVSSIKKVDNGLYRSIQIRENEFVDDSSIFRDVDISEIMETGPIKFLVSRFVTAGISLMVKDITQEDIGIPTFVASSVEWITSDYGYFAKGFGTHLDSRIALIRAISELSQTRAVNIQGARDDLKKIQYKENDEIYRRKWQFMSAKESGQEKRRNNIMFSEIRSHIKKNVLDDIRLILTKLKKAGLKRAIIVELTNPNVGIPVVRAIVPGLETFEVAKIYTSTELVFGWRAKKYFRKTHDL